MKRSYISLMLLLALGATVGQASAQWYGRRGYYGGPGYYGRGYYGGPGYYGDYYDDSGAVIGGAVAGVGSIIGGIAAGSAARSEAKEARKDRELDVREQEARIATLEAEADTSAS